MGAVKPYRVLAIQHAAGHRYTGIYLIWESSVRLNLS